MRKIILGLMILTAILPISILAKSEVETIPPQQMMQNLEDRALGTPLQQEMYGLMNKMMSGNGLTDEEITKMVSYMNQYPGPYNMMMNRMMGQNLGWGESRDNMWSMMNWANNSGWGGWFGSFGFITSLVWLGIGVLLLVWLAKKVFAKK